jgi:hypothetical protein
MGERDKGLGSKSSASLAEEPCSLYLQIRCVGGISPSLGNHTGKAYVFASIAFQHTDLFWLGRIPGL